MENKAGTKKGVPTTYHYLMKNKTLMDITLLLARLLLLAPPPQGGGGWIIGVQIWQQFRESIGKADLLSDNFDSNNPSTSPLVLVARIELEARVQQCHWLGYASMLFEMKRVQWNWINKKITNGKWKKSTHNIFIENIIIFIDYNAPICITNVKCYVNLLWEKTSINTALFSQIHIKYCNILMLTLFSVSIESRTKLCKWPLFAPEILSATATTKLRWRVC